MKRAWLRCGWVALVVLAAACAPRHSSPFSGERHRSGSVTLRVDNRHWADMTISVVRGGARARLGQVSTNGDQTFRLPPGMDTPGVSVYFEADPVGSDQVYRSPLVALGPDEDYVWTLAVNLEHSTLVRR
jgi:hypothetical protein